MKNWMERLGEWIFYGILLLACLTLLISTGWAVLVDPSLQLPVKLIILSIVVLVGLVVVAVVKVMKEE